MSSFKLFLHFFLHVVLNLACTQASDHSISLVQNQNCSNNEDFIANNAYQSNLNSLLSSLSSNATRAAQFYNATSHGGNSSNRVYGLFLCRGDVSQQVCRECVVNATQRIVNATNQLASQCRLPKESVIWYDDCLVRYSNRSFFSAVDQTPQLAMLSTSNAADQDSFIWTLQNTLNEVASKAANSGPAGTKKFATKKSNLNSSATVYTLAQCTHDLSSQDCNTCLRDLIGVVPSCCLGKQGGRVFFPSCNLRFELYQFYTDLDAAQVLSSAKGKIRSSTIVLIVVPAIVVLAILLCLGWSFLRRKARKGHKDILRENFGNEITTWESLQFDFATIEAATDNFSQENRIGKGGFGVVYKGVLKSSGQEIAVKRLSRSSGQGAVEFKNEVLLIAKLQHRNLVTLLGFCLEELEKILVYEYVPNKSLDYFLFDHQKPRILTWSERYKIIGGIARGILYLHEHSRLKVIHRDLKPSNILLDGDMNPKISDFGLAKMVSIDHAQGSTNRVVGTYGYMSPEYAMHGKFSTKSDIFSFGVMVLEVVSGKRNTCSFESHRVDDLLSNAWKQWNDQTPLQILDPMLEESYARDEVKNCIQIGLLCVQGNPDDRPSMSTVVSYFSTHSVVLPSPREPVFSMHGRLEPSKDAHNSGSTQSNNSMASSVNEMSISQSIPR